MIGAELAGSNDDNAAWLEVSVEEALDLRRSRRFASERYIEGRPRDPRIGATIGAISSRSIVLSRIHANCGVRPSIDAHRTEAFAQVFSHLSINEISERLLI